MNFWQLKYLSLGYLAFCVGFPYIRPFFGAYSNGWFMRYLFEFSGNNILGMEYAAFQTMLKNAFMRHPDQGFTERHKNDYIQGI